MSGSVCVKQHNRRGGDAQPDPQNMCVWSLVGDGMEKSLSYWRSHSSFESCPYPCLGPGGTGEHVAVRASTRCIEIHPKNTHPYHERLPPTRETRWYQEIRLGGSLQRVPGQVGLLRPLLKRSVQRGPSKPGRVTQACRPKQVPSAAAGFASAGLGSVGGWLSVCPETRSLPRGRGQGHVCLLCTCRVP